MPKKDSKPVASVPAPRKPVDVEDLQKAAVATPALLKAQDTAALKVILREKQREAVGPSPAVLKLQDKVVELFEQRGEARKRLSELHSAYLLAQTAFQIGEANVKAAEQDAQYIISLIAQLENRAPQAPVLNFPAPPIEGPRGAASFADISSEPTPQQINYAVGSADDLRKEMRGMM